LDDSVDYKVTSFFEWSPTFRGTSSLFVHMEELNTGYHWRD